MRRIKLVTRKEGQEDYKYLGSDMFEHSEEKCHTNGWFLFFVLSTTCRKCNPAFLKKGFGVSTQFPDEWQLMKCLSGTLKRQFNGLHADR